MNRTCAIIKFPETQSVNVSEKYTPSFYNMNTRSFQWEVQRELLYPYNRIVNVQPLKGTRNGNMDIRSRWSQSERPSFFGKHFLKATVSRGGTTCKQTCLHFLNTSNACSIGQWCPMYPCQIPKHITPWPIWNIFLFMNFAHERVFE